MKSAKELLRAKRDGATWDADDVAWFVDGLVRGSVTAPQAAAFLMAACTRGLAPTEVAALTVAMARSGDQISPGLTPRPRVDKHSTGGVGDKVSLLLAPLAASCGLAVPMISGRGLGHTGGTVDKLESVPGMRMLLAHHELEQLLADHHLFMAAQSANLAPADRTLYALRDVTGTVENVGLITSSILSKKFAEGLDGLVMDVKTGGAAFMRDLALAEDLAASIRNVALLAGLPLHVLFTRMDRPLGRAAGNWVEVVEAEQALASRTTASADLVEVTVELVAHMLLLGGLCTSLAGARTQVVGEWDTGRPHAAFHGMLQRQGGDYDAGVQRHATALQRILTTSTDGYVQHIDGMPVAMAVLQAGGGRLKETDSIDPDVGVEVVTTVGAHLKRGEATFKLSATTMDQLDRMEQTLQSAVHMATAPVEPEPSMILQRWT